jgi:DNA-binding Lrp family transcriptional regulator
MTRHAAIDRTDFVILRLLTNNARLSNKEIAAAVGLAPSSCHERIKELHRRDILLGAHAEVKLKALGFVLEALLFVQLAKLKQEVVDKFLKKTAAVPEIRSAFLVSGRYDLIVHVAVRDMAHLKNIISKHFNRYAVVLRVETSVVFDHEVRHSIPALGDWVVLRRSLKKPMSSTIRRSAGDSHRRGCATVDYFTGWPALPGFIPNPAP